MSKGKKKKVCVAIFSRANYGSIRNVLNELKKSKKIKLQILTGGSASVEKYGLVSNLIRKDDFKVDKEYLSKNNLKNEKDLRDKVDENFKNQYINYLREIEKKQLMDILESKNDFDIPEGIPIWSSLQSLFNFSLFSLSMHS